MSEHPGPHRCVHGDATWVTGSGNEDHDLVVSHLVAGFDALGLVALATGGWSVADVLVLRESGVPLLVEVKTRKGGRRPGGLSTHQARARDFCRDHGYGWVTLYAIGEVRRIPVGKGPLVAYRLLPPEDVRIRASSSDDRVLVERAFRTATRAHR